MILELIAEARAAGARLGPCCEVVELDVRTVQRWLKHGPDGGEDLRRGPKTPPANKLSQHEREQMSRSCQGEHREPQLICDHALVDYCSIQSITETVQSMRKQK